MQKRQSKIDEENKKHTTQYMLDTTVRKQTLIIVMSPSTNNFR
jgi:hypothetical protein